MVPEGFVTVPISPIDIVVYVGVGAEVVNDILVADECFVLDVVDVVIDILIDIAILGMDIPSIFGWIANAAQ